MSSPIRSPMFKALLKTGRWIYSFEVRGKGKEQTVTHKLAWFFKQCEERKLVPRQYVRVDDDKGFDVYEGDIVRCNCGHHDPKVGIVEVDRFYGVHVEAVNGMFECGGRDFDELLERDRIHVIGHKDELVAKSSFPPAYDDDGADNLKYYIEYKEWLTTPKKMVGRPPVGAARLKWLWGDGE